MKKEKLDKSLKFGRSLYIPYRKVLVISGEYMEGNNSVPVRDTFIHCLATNRVERMPDIRVPRTSFAAHYDFGDRYVYVIGGCDGEDMMLRDCEKFDVLNQRWVQMPPLNHKRGNPGTFITPDRRYLYVF